MALQILNWTEDNLAYSNTPEGQPKQDGRFFKQKKGARISISLSMKSLQRIVGRWGFPQVDLFSSQACAKVPVYFSLNRQDQAAVLDALAQYWTCADDYFSAQKTTGRE